MQAPEPWYCYEDPDESATVVRQFMGDVRHWRAPMLAAYHRLAELYERELWEAIYASGRSAGLTDSDADGSGRWWSYEGNRRPSDNITKGATDALDARLFGETPRLKVEALGGDYMTHLQAQRKTWALTTTLDTTANRLVIKDARNDALKTGVGAVVPEVFGGSFRLARVLLDDLWWHPFEARDHRRPHDPPRSLHWVKRVTRQEAIEMVCAMNLDEQDEESLEHAIRSLPSATMAGSNASNYDTPYDRYITQTSVMEGSDLVGIVRSWHLPSSVDADDGVELVQVTSLTGADPSDTGVAIYRGAWTHETHPVVWWSPYPVHQGLVALGIGHTLEPYQYQQDWSWEAADRLIKDWGIPNVALPAEMDTPEDKANIAGSQSVNFVKIPGMGQTGKFYELLQHNAQNPQLLMWLDSVPARAYQSIGLNQGVAMGGTRLSGNVSGVALNAEDTRADVRFANVLTEADAWQIALAEETLNALDRAREQDPSFAVRVKDAWGTEEHVPWTELKITAGAYDVRIEQLGALGRTAAARLRSIQELQGVAPTVAAAALQATYVTHDLPSVAREANSDREYIQWQLYYLAFYASAEEDRAEKLAPYWPDELVDLEEAERLSRAELQRAKRCRADDDVLEILTEYRARIQARRQEAQAASQPAVPTGAPLAGLGEASPGPISGADIMVPPDVPNLGA